MVFSLQRKYNEVIEAVNKQQANEGSKGVSSNVVCFIYVALNFCSFSNDKLSTLYINFCGREQGQIL